MPMHQPDCDLAYKEGEAAAEKIIKQLVKEYKLDEGNTPRQKTMWENAKKDVVDAIANLFVESTCNSF